MSLVLFSIRSMSTPSIADRNFRICSRARSPSTRVEAAAAPVSSGSAKTVVQTEAAAAARTNAVRREFIFTLGVFGSKLSAAFPSPWITAQSAMFPYGRLYTYPSTRSTARNVWIIVNDFIVVVGVEEIRSAKKKKIASIINVSPSHDTRTYSLCSADFSRPSSPIIVFGYRGERWSAPGGLFVLRPFDTIVLWIPVKIIF